LRRPPFEGQPFLNYDGNFDKFEPASIDID
jgi:hypothetical protein